jgi:phospholipid/cholesterol/gamma-HCH transport system permease protein
VTSLGSQLTRPHVAAARASLWSMIGSGEGPLRLDLSAVEEVDSAGAALLALFARELQKNGRRLELVGARPAVRETLDLFPFDVSPAPVGPPPPGVLERLGSTAVALLGIVVHFGSILADAFVFLVQGLLRPRTMRWKVVTYEMSALGSQATGVVATIAFLVGGTMALQSAAQLRQFGANVFVVDLIGISMTRELGPLMAAIMVAGRSGSAVAAEIGTMVINEEVDALDTMGINPIRFLVVPKLLAITITQPLLTVLANVAGIFGGFLVAVLYLDVGPSTFLDRLQGSLLLKDLVTGLVKAVLFAQLIVSVGALCGFRTKGGADAVGRSTTTSVVAGIFCVITADAIASIVFYF